jgi:integrase
MRRYVLPYLGDVRLRNLTGPKVKAWLQDLRSTRSRLGNNLSDATVSRSYRTLHRCLRDAELGINPADDIKKKPRVDLHEQNFDRVTWEPDELDSFLGHVAQCDQSGGVRLFALWTVLARTGMRRGEGLGLRWSDIDLKREELSVRQTIGVDGHQLYLNNTPKGKRSRTIPFIEDDTPRLLSEWREIQALEKQYAGDRWDPDPQFGSNLVFTNEIGRPIHPSNMSKWFQQHVGHLGDQVRRTNLHGLRHAHGSHLIGAWLPLKVAADRLGHTVAVLESTYAHEIRALSDDSREEMRERYRKLSTSPPPV